MLALCFSQTRVADQFNPANVLLLDDAAWRRMPQPDNQNNSVAAMPHGVSHGTRSTLSLYSTSSCIVMLNIENTRNVSPTTVLWLQRQK